MSAVATGVAAVAAGVTLVCPPCAVVTWPVVGFAGTTAYYTGIAGTATTCIADGLITFDCAVSSVSTGAGSGFRRVSKTVLEKLGLEPPDDPPLGAFMVFIGAAGIWCWYYDSLYRRLRRPPPTSRWARLIGALGNAGKRVGPAIFVVGVVLTIAL